jgi:hypothetical protein
MPAKPYRNEVGEETWSAIVDFVDAKARARFTTQALKAIDEYRQRGPEGGAQ